MLAYSSNDNCSKEKGLGASVFIGVWKVGESNKGLVKIEVSLSE